MSCVMSPADPNRRWTYGRVPFVFDALGFGGGRNTPRRDAVQMAIDCWNSLGLAVRFVPRSAEQSFVVFTPNPVPMWPGLIATSTSSASTAIGMGGGAQRLWVSMDATPGLILHELGHVVGLSHEQNRADRNDHVKILWENVDPAGWSQFRQALIGTNDYGAYDFCSIMHYGLSDYSWNNLPTMRALDNNTGCVVGQRIDLSEGDKAGVEFLYNDRLFVTVAFPAFAAFTYPAEIAAPPLSADVPPFSVTPPQVTVSPPKVTVAGRDFDVPSFAVQPDPVTVSPPAVDVDPPPFPVNEPPVMATPPPVRVPRHLTPMHVTLTPAPMTVDPPVVTVDPPSVTITPPSVRIAPPAFTVRPPSFRVGPIEVQPPELQVTPPEMTVNPPPITVDPPPLTLAPPPITVDPPPFDVRI